MRPYTFFLISMVCILACCNNHVEANNRKRVQNNGKNTGDKDTLTKLGNNIMLVYQDKKNNYWFGSWKTGLYLYDGKTIVHFTTKDGLPNNRINEIKEDNFGNVYFNTSGGVCKYDGKSFSTLPLSQTHEWKLEPDDVWFKNEQDSGHVCRYDGKFLHKLTFPPLAIAEKWMADHPDTKGDPRGVYTVYKDSHGNIWFGSGAAGVCRYNGKRHDWITSSDVNEMHNGPSNGVRSIIEDKDGNFWFCNTIYKYTIYGVTIPANLSHDKFYYYREKGIGPLDGQDKDFQEYMSAALDTNGHVWMASYGAGVYQYTGKKIIHHPVRAGDKDITVFSIYKDNHGNLWLGTHENGAYKFNGKTFERFKP